MKKKKTLVILLAIPFVIGLLSFVSIAILTNTVAADILDISWAYRENEGFKIREAPYLLEATAIVDEDLLLAPHSDELVWTLQNLDGSEEEYATIEPEGEAYYLHAREEGAVRITCANRRGTKSKSFTAHIYESGAILVNRARPSSGKNVDPTYYVGQYDLAYEALEMDGARLLPAQFDLEPTLLGEGGAILSRELTANVQIAGNRVKVLAPGPARIEFYTISSPYLRSEFAFEVLENACNVYRYDDLLMASNFSSVPRGAVLQVNLESLKNTYRSEKGEKGETRYLEEKLPNKENTELFGNFDFATQRFSFESEAKRVESSYPTDFIRQYNASTGANAETSVLVGIELKGDLYGNGFSINGNDLCYPNYGKVSASSGKIEPDPARDHFFGPLPFVTIGSLEKMPVVKAYGQDNALIYLKGDGLTINDVEIANTNQVDNMYNLMYAGTVVEVAGKNSAIRNSIIGNGRTGVRAFSSDGLRIDNCILRNAAEFLLKLGSNEIAPYDKGKTVSATYNGKEFRAPFADFYDLENPSSPYNLILNEVLSETKIADPAKAKEVMATLLELQSGLDSTAPFLEGDGVAYASTVSVSSSHFANSGIFSIAFETMFNGPFLYNGGPSLVKEATDLFSSLSPREIGGTSAPVELVLDGKTRFHDWKDIDKIDSSILIEENISATIKAMFGKDLELSMEDYFPMKRLLAERCDAEGCLYEEEGKKYVNSKIAWYGGGLNLSKLTLPAAGAEGADLSSPLEVAITEAILQGKHISNAHELIALLAKCVSMATGVHPFRFITNARVDGKPEDFGSVPQIEDLKNAFTTGGNV